jgi:hypothetical protein
MPNRCKPRFVRQKTRATWEWLPRVCLKPPRSIRPLALASTDGRGAPPTVPQSPRGKSTFDRLSHGNGASRRQHPRELALFLQTVRSCFRTGRVEPGA